MSKEKPVWCRKCEHSMTKRELRGLEVQKILGEQWSSHPGICPVVAKWLFFFGLAVLGCLMYFKPWLS